MLKRFFKIVKNIVFAILTVVVLALVLVNLTPVQNYLAHEAANMLSKKLKTNVSIDKVRFDLLNHIMLQGVNMQDQNKDTLLYAGKLQVRITDWFLGKKPVLHYLGLSNTLVHLYRTPQSNIWNYQFLGDAFASGTKDTTTSRGNQFEFDLNKIVIDNVRFHIDDSWIGYDMNYDIGNLALDAKNLDLNKKLLDINELTINQAKVSLISYIGGRPKQAIIPDTTSVAVDTTPFNPDMWGLIAKTVTLTDCRFVMENNSKIPAAGEFDADHLDITGIQVKIEGTKIIGDTIFGNLVNLAAHERCGIAIKSMRSKISVSPIASVCDNLLLETNYSKIKNYYAMHYKHFPSFLSYIDSVTMVGKLKEAIVDERDVAYFAPLLKTFPQVVLKVSGEGRGTVSNLAGYSLLATDGSTTIKGNATIKGLPDIYKSKIGFNNGEIITSGIGILKYVPSLKNSPDVAFEQLLFAYFKGSYNGYIDNFAVKGTIATNLGNITTDVNMQLPNFNPDSAKYTGNITTTDLLLGVFLHQPDILGGITLNENVTGFSFNPEIAQVNLDGNISELALKGYPYHNIATKGILAKKQFTGSLLVDDPNLALEFDGAIDFSAKLIDVKAKAHLLSCNFKELKLIDDNFTASADFDLDCIGSNIDNFEGYARLDNIDIKRNNHKLALDSVLVLSTGDSTNKTLTVQSNAVVAKIKGDYRLSKLPASFQYYLSNYLPSYIKAPEKSAPEQNLEFTVNTTGIDSLLAIVVPEIRGFDNSYISGLFNTVSQQLSLVANVPFGSFGKFHLINVATTCQGNLNALSINTNIDNVSMGDSALNGSVGVTATLGNDLLQFNIATTTPDSSSAIVLNGQIIAHQDSLFLTLSPSAFYLNQIKWDIAGDCKAVYSNRYLFVDKLSISSGMQKINAGFQQQGTDQIITINTQNLDIGQIGTWAGLGYYQPDGRINGTIKIINVLQQPYISANIIATNVKLGADTIGTINIVSDYDQTKKLAIIDPQTGIFNGSSSIMASGKISFDSNVNQQLDGVIQFTNTQIAGASPFVAGIFSKLGGTLSGKINIGGKSYAPEIDGTVVLKNGGFHLDYMGCSYTIPTATVHIDNNKINLGEIKIKDSYNNTAYVKGYFSHRLFKDMYMHINVRSDELEVMKLTKTDNNYFYGNVIAGMDSFTITGSFTDIYLNAYNLYPAAKSHIVIPVATTGDAGTYSYISFKTYGKDMEKPVAKNQVKINVDIDANLNNYADISILLDPVTGDAIDAKGEGNIQLKMPANNDMRITGTYNIESGTYTFSFKQLEYKKQFKLNAGSTIFFKGPFAATSMDVFATYTAKARLFELLSTTEQQSLNSNDLTDAKRIQPVDITLHMQEAIFNPKLSFDLNIDDKHMESNPAYTKLQQINQDDRQKFDQVASLLLTGNFLSQDGLFGNNSVKTGALNNFSQMLSGTASTTLTNVVNKLMGERKVNINVNYQNYNYSDVGVSNINRNQFSGTISKNYLDDRLVVEVGGKSDWGHQVAASSASSYNISGDFRVQYLISPTGRLRLNCFSTSDYDVTLERQITRSGVGISWRKSFENLNEFFTPENKTLKDKTKRQNVVDTTLQGKGN